MATREKTKVQEAVVLDQQTREALARIMHVVLKTSTVCMRRPKEIGVFHQGVVDSEGESYNNHY